MRRAPWVRIAVEGAAVVASILLAFAIDRSWERYRSRQAERESLEVVSRDLDAAIDQLREYRTRVNDVAAASFGAYQALTSAVPESEREAVSRQIRSAFRRITVVLPRAGYTDLVWGGGLGQVTSRPLRDSIVGFYEYAERTVTIVEKNTSTYTDGFMGQVFTVDGLILRRPDGDPRLESRLEPDFKHPTDPLWEFSQGSAEWRRARSVLLQNGRGAQLNLGYADEMLDAAGELQRSIRSYLGQSGRTF